MQTTNAQNIIDQLPDQAKRQVLSSLVGSLNASIIGTADTVVSILNAKEIDPREVEPREIELHMRGTDESNERLINVRRTMRVAQNLRDQLLVLTNDDSRSTISSTLDFMTAPSKRKVMTDDPEVKQLLAALKLSESDIKLAEAAQASSDAQRAEQLAQRRGTIEWVIEKVYSSHSHDEIDERGKLKTISDVEDNLIEYLPADMQERVYDKLTQALNRERDNTIRGVLFKDRRYSFGDIPLIDAAISEAKWLDAHNENDEIQLGGQTVKPNATTQFKGEASDLIKTRQH